MCERPIHVHVGLSSPKKDNNIYFTLFGVILLPIALIVGDSFRGRMRLWWP